MADTTVKIEVDGTAAINTLKQLTQANKDFENSAKASVKATNEAGKGIDEMSAAVTRARPHMIQLIQDLAEGRGALKSFSAQGVDIVKSFGSIGAALEGLGGLLISPIGLFAALAAGIGTVAYQAHKGGEEMDKLKNQLSLTNDYAGVTSGSINALAVSMAGGSVTAGDMREVFGKLAASGHFTSDAMREVAQSVKLVSQLSGESADTVSDKLMKAFNGSISGIKELNAQYHFLTTAQYEQIDSLIKNGENQKAVALASGILNEQLGKQKVEVGTLTGFWNKLKEGVSDYLTIFQGFGQKEEDKLGQQLTLLKKNQEALDAVTKNPGLYKFQIGAPMYDSPETYERRIKEIQTRIDAIRDANRKKDEDAEKKSAEIVKRERETTISEANKGLASGVELEQKRIGFAERKAALDAQAASQGDAQVAKARAQLTYEEKIAALEAERTRINELEPMRASNTNARIDAAKRIAQVERDDAIKVADIKERNAEKEFSDLLRIHNEKLKQGQGEIDQGEIIRKQKQNQIELENILRERLKKIGDPEATGTQGKALKAQVDAQKALDDETIRSTELNKLNFEISTKLRNKLTEDTITQTEKLKDQREEILAGSNLEVTLIKEKIRLREEEKAKIVAIQNVFGDQSKLTQQQIDDQKQLTDAVRAEYDKRRNDSENAIRSDDQITKTKEFGLEASLARISKMALTPAGIVSSVVDTMFNNMSKALDNFVDTGKLSFSNFTESVIKDLLKIALHESEVALFKAAGGASGIGAGLLSFFGGFFADGGSPPMGKASIVGENGPELFIPRTPGTIIPNDMLGGGGSVQNNNYHNYTISAIDAKSVAQLFYENRMTMFGVTERARRELPMRTR